MKHTTTSTRLRRTATLALPLLALVASLAMAGCSDYYYTANIQGYVIDDNTVNGTTGVNNATIWFYQSDPGAVGESDTAGPAGFFAKTSTAAQGNNDGYYSAKVIWNNPQGKFGTEGDTTSFWVVITQENYKTAKFELPGILSKATNTVPDLRVKRATFKANTVVGRVLDTSGKGINGIRVVVNLYPDSTNTDISENEDYVVNTNTPAGGVDGTFTFQDVTWRNATATGTTDSHQIRIRITDTQYKGKADLLVTVTSGGENTLPDSQTLTAVRKPRSSFSADTVTGRILDANGKGLNGVRVVLNLYPDDPDATVAANEDYVATTATPNGGEAGTFTFQNVTWTDTAATGETDTHTVRIRLADTQYQGDKELRPTISSDVENTLTSGSTITASRKPYSDFTANLQGRIQKHFAGSNGDSYAGAQGVTVRLSYATSASTTKIIETQTDANGQYSFSLAWTDTTPGNYDDGASDLTAVDTSLPTSEDGLLYSISFEKLPTKVVAGSPTKDNLVEFNGMPARSYTGSAATVAADTTVTYTNQKLSSDKNPNYFPDGILELQ
jgi:hypothetical protein